MTTKPSTKFKPGQSGNPKGRTPGKTPRSMLRSAIAGQIPELVNRLLSASAAGDVGATKALLGYVVPPLKPVLDAAPLAGAEGGLPDKARAVVQAMVDGRLSPDAAGVALGALASMAKIEEQSELIARLDRLEAVLTGKASPGAMVTQEVHALASVGDSLNRSILRGLVNVS